ncbi:O-antigen ligase [Sphingomonas sp. BK345]|nr:O-antigen ligase [Sphingomonas sp. BK345]
MAMHPRRRRAAVRGGLLAMILFLVCLWAAGGASREDVLGQVIVRAVAWGAVVVLALLAPAEPRRIDRMVPALLFASLALVLLQLIPLPPALWAALPGRGSFAPVDTLAGGPVWRPAAIVPGAAINAAGALIVPIATFALMRGVARSDDGRLLATLLALVVASALVGVIQFAGSGLSNPFVNSGGEPSSVFANRNHFALFLAIGCVLAPAWAGRGERLRAWRLFVAAAVTLLLLLLIVASGSRAGMLVGVVAVAAGAALIAPRARLSFGGLPRWAAPAAMAAFALVIVLLIALSYGENRAMGIDRALNASVNGDMRRRGLPTVLSMIAQYFPVGSGFGGFDPLFRLHEPYDLLKPTYFNHAHNDVLELLLDGGLPAAALLLVAPVWWARRSITAWRALAAAPLPVVGSVILFIVAVASMFDYPARTPMIMALLVVAAAWLSDAGALPDAGEESMRIRRSMRTT